MIDRTVRCLVVDDDDTVRRTLVELLSRSGYQCEGVASGVEALESLRQETVQVVITDFQMPGMDGMQLLTAVRSEWPDVAVVMVTGVADIRVAVSCLQLGAHDFITKPFQLADLQARVEQALDKRRLLLENRRYQHHLEEMVQEQASRIQEVFLEGIQSLAHALDAKDSYTHGHSARVRAYAGGMARELSLPKTRIQVIELGAELHDVGKIGVSEAVLLKPGKLTREEYHHLMQHTVTGAKILEPMLKGAPDALQIVRSHHERLDGTGLPDGLAGDQIPLHVRIVTVADSFDAMTTVRPYRKALPIETALEELNRCTGAQFDGQVVEAFTKAFPDGTQFPIRTEPKRRLIPEAMAGVLRDTS